MADLKQRLLARKALVGRAKLASEAPLGTCHFMRAHRWRCCLVWQTPLPKVKRRGGS
jgi:hypothetical protein